MTPVAGFRNVNKVLAQGQPLGAITGSTYLRDENNNRVIGPDGFPLVDHTPSVIGNPFPDFIAKLTHSFTWKSLSFNFDMEWKKGSEV